MSPAGSESGGARRWLGAAALALAAALTSACGERPAAPAAPAAAPKTVAAAPMAPPGEATMELGRAVWNYRCYFCHGYSGDAKTLATSYLNPKPRNFQETRPEEMPHERVMSAVRHGVPNTAMKGFTGILNDQEMEAVSQFLRQEFLVSRAKNTRYHTREAGWPDHEQRYAKAFPFARGDIAIDTPWDKLSAEQQEGMRMFRTSCITCHDHGKVNDPGKAWESRPVSFPRDAYCSSCHQDVPRSEPAGVSHPQRPATHTFAERDGSVPVRSPTRPEAQVASNYVIHDKPPVLVNASAQELQGEKLFHRNCAFCHAGDGTSKGWIGSFLEPHPRDLTDPQQMKGMTKERLVRSINEGLPNTSMPAWKSVLSPAEIDALAAYIHKAFHPVQGMAASPATKR